ncbi:MAG: UDP-N-acetylmuramate--L-alanine ligase [Myxococcales bacterium]|nr:UDP-N-acetylmuramate--L-alanine ligase [Myxococcales bacterium]
MSTGISGTWHLIGIGGIGVSAVARLLHSRGAKVQGSDVRESQLTLALRDLGIGVHIGHDAAHLAGVDTVVVSTAIPETNPELVAARAQGMEVVHRSEVLGRLLQERQSVGVIGTHGKGTVSGATTWLLDAGGHEPGYIIGGLLLNYNNNARDGDTWMVAEVDESDGSLINSQPTVAILNNLELDHLNYYKDWAQLEQLVLRFFLDNPRLELAVINIDDPGARKIYAQLSPLRERGVRVVGFGFESEDADYRGINLNNHRMRGSFDLVHREQGALGPVAISLPGDYNASNVLGAMAIALEVGVPFETVQQAAPQYKGLENRFTLVDANGVEVVKDYISHPTGIRRVLQAARGQADGEVVAVFKPYRFTMIHYLQDDYALAFKDADRVVVTELYTAGEVPIPGTDTDMLCRRIREQCDEVTYVHELERIPSWLGDHVAAPATVLFFGGDDLFEVADSYVAQRGGHA